MGTPSVSDLIKRGGMTKRGASLVAAALLEKDVQVAQALEEASGGKFRGQWTGNEFKSAVAIPAAGLPVGVIGSGLAYSVLANHGGAGAPIGSHIMRAGVSSGGLQGASSLTLVAPAGVSEIRFRWDHHRIANTSFGGGGFWIGASPQFQTSANTGWAEAAYPISPGQSAIWSSYNDIGGTYGTIDAGDIEWWGPAEPYVRGDIVVYNGRLYQVTGESVTTTPGAVGWQDIGTVAAPKVSYSFDTSAGNAAVGSGTRRLYNDTGRTLTIVGARISVGTAPTGSALTVDVNKNGTTIFTTQANRPSIAAAAFTAKTTAVDTPLWGDGEYLTFDVDAVGSTVPGADLKVSVIAEG